MWFVGVGLLLVGLKLAEIGPTASWSWFVVLAPFVGAVIWWHWADSTGWTKRKQMDRMDERKEQRRQRQIDAMGLDPKKKRK